MALQRPTKRTLVEQIVSQLEQLIENGTWPVGERIPAEPELVKELGVSRNTIREAVHALIHAGMLRTRQGDGTYVCSSSSLTPILARRLERSKLSETLEVRSALEQEGARLAALRRTVEDITRIQSANDDRRKAIEAEDTEASIHADYLFHREIINAAHNSILSDLYDSISEAVQQVVTYGSSHLALTRLHTEYNERLIQAIIAQDETGSADSVRAYIEASREMLQKDIQGGNELHHE
ncbi:FadR/GntR family transcriptional regulator [Paenibacillus dokdonensis]|uniref:FadR/GntR family transcriptional regulator n=1 Tax=Paenibacillus dokdonensis TaxID=2567944 RepID=A0ABU6GQE3_9BACL|nr:FadR/GntR family transcriptional regulator [Paenibacillus dokdonensis]MEC0241619.1 FadR/GntR family transcriptional regulator [Paenibacillus dokdonensis]